MGESTRRQQPTCCASWTEHTCTTAPFRGVGWRRRRRLLETPGRAMSVPGQTVADAMAATLIGTTTWDDLDLGTDRASITKIERGGTVTIEKAVSTKVQVPGWLKQCLGVPLSLANTRVTRCCAQLPGMAHAASDEATSAWKPGSPTVPKELARLCGWEPQRPTSLRSLGWLHGPALWGAGM